MESEETKVWTAFGLLGLAWGSSFFFIEIALRELPPLTLVSARVGIGVVGLLIFLLLSPLRLPRSARRWGQLLLLGLFNPALPFLLITWGQQFTSSAVAGILNGTVPLFSMVFAHLALPDERFTLPKLGALLTGFLGVILIFGQDLNAGGGPAGLGLLTRLQGQLAMVGAAVCYGGTAVYVRRSLRGVTPLVVAAGSQVGALFAVGLAALLLEGLPLRGLGAATVGAVAWLGLMGTSIAYILNFFIIQQWGATRATMVTYLIPVVAFALGALLLDEPVTWHLVLGGALILSAISLVNRPRLFATALGRAGARRRDPP